MSVTEDSSDGLNPIGQECAVAQLSNGGVLVLSDQAGAHDPLGDSAASVSPYETGTFADRLEEALTLPRRKRRARMNEMRQTVSEHDLESWIGRNATAAFDTLDDREPFTSSM